jgi:hypothetical protein
MAIIISSGPSTPGNIRVVKQSGTTAELEIVTDHMSDFYQWFHFRLAGAAGREVTLKITNCGGSAYPDGWPDYKACVSHRPRGLDRDRTAPATPTASSPSASRRKPRSSGSLTSRLIRWSGTTTLVSTIAALPGVDYRSLGKSLDGQDIDCLTSARAS